MTPAFPDDDAHLMERAGQDDRGAFETLVRRHQRPLMNFFMRSGVDRHAEDLVQQTFIRLYRYRHRYRPSAKFTTFLYLLARQVRIDEIRRCQRRRNLWERLRRQAEIETGTAAGAVAPAELPDELQQALAELSERQREVVILGVLQELDYAAIAGVLGIPVGTVKSRMFNGLRELRKRLESNKRDERS